MSCTREVLRCKSSTKRSTYSSTKTLCPPELKVRTPARAIQLGWYVEFESRVTHPQSEPLSWHGTSLMISEAIVTCSFLYFCVLTKLNGV